MGGISNVKTYLFQRSAYVAPKEEDQIVVESYTAKTEQTEQTTIVQNSF
jgi:hypothetical protein